MSPQPDVFERWLLWEPNTRVPQDVTPLAEALLKAVYPSETLILGLADPSGQFLVELTTARTAGPTYTHAVRIPLRPSTDAPSTIWQRAASRTHAVRQLHEGTILLAHGLTIGDRLLGVMAVADPDHSRPLARRFRQGVVQASLALAAWLQAQNRAVTYRFWRASAQTAQAYATSESMDDTQILSAMVAAVRNGLQVDRCVLIESSGRKAHVPRQFVAGIRHLWPASTGASQDAMALEARLMAEEEGQAADGLVAWFPMGRDGDERLTLLVDNLLSEIPLPPRDHPGWTTLGRSIVGFWKVWRRLETLRTKAERDDLTGLFNRAGGMPLARDWIARAKEWKGTATLILFDVDHFKGINDHCGHLAGDAILTAIGHWLLHHLRSEDVAVRYGGDEFLLVLPDVSASIGPQIIDRIFGGITEMLRTIPDLPHPTISLGVAQAPDHGTNLASLIEAADQALYQVKALGGNAWHLLSDAP
jgi:diguanylate cyclase (GGDEF)-like protein